MMAYCAIVSALVEIAMRNGSLWDEDEDQGMRQRYVFHSTSERRGGRLGSKAGGRAAPRWAAGFDAPVEGGTTLKCSANALASAANSSGVVPMRRGAIDAGS